MLWQQLKQRAAVQAHHPVSLTAVAGKQGVSQLCVLPCACAGVAKGGVAVVGGLVVFWILQKVSSFA
jgi:hypothetical protein